MQSVSDWSEFIDENNYIQCFLSKIRRELETVIEVDCYNKKSSSFGN